MFHTIFSYRKISYNLGNLINRKILSQFTSFSFYFDCCSFLLDPFIYKVLLVGSLDVEFSRIQEIIENSRFQRFHEFSISR